MEHLCAIQKTLIDMVECQLLNPQIVDTKELGEAVDMIKDLEETIYYSTIVHAMHEPKATIEEDWSKKGHSPMARETYLILKDGNHSKEEAMKELEKYMQELSNDIFEMIKEATPEEKALLQKKIAVLATKINV